MSYDEEQQKRSRVVVETPTARREVVHQQTTRYPERSGYSAGTVAAVALTAIATTAIIVLFLMNSRENSSETDVNVRTTAVEPTPLTQNPVMVQQTPMTMPTPIVIQQPPPVVIQQPPVETVTTAPPSVTTAPPVSSGTDDTQLQLQIERAFRTDPEIALSNIIATVVGGKATLTGEVKSPALKQRAERLVREVKDLKSVENRVTVNPDMP